MKVLEHIVSISASEAADRSKLLQKLQDADSLVLLPVLQASNKMMDMVITERSFRLIEKNHTKLNVTLRNGGIAIDEAWTRLLDTKLDTLDPVIGQNLSQIDVASSYAELSYTATIKVHQPHFDYLLYPFDAQIVKLHFEPGVNITSCGTNVFLEDSEHPLVSGSYIFGTPRVSSMHSSVRTADGGCTIEIPGALARVRRSRAPSPNSARRAEAPSLQARRRWLLPSLLQAALTPMGMRMSGGSLTHLLELPDQGLHAGCAHCACGALWNVPRPDESAVAGLPHGADDLLDDALLRAESSHTLAYAFDYVDRLAHGCAADYSGDGPARDDGGSPAGPSEQDSHGARARQCAALVLARHVCRLSRIPCLVRASPALAQHASSAAWEVSPL
jgi:hypothetical protein